MKIAWVCDECNWLQVSDSKEHHKMDNCKCGKCGVDLEEYYERHLGNPRTLAFCFDGMKWETYNNKNQLRRRYAKSKSKKSR